MEILTNIVINFLSIVCITDLDKVNLVIVVWFKDQAISCNDQALLKIGVNVKSG